MKLYLVMDIGCIECGEYSNPLGLFRTEDEAMTVCNEASKAHQQHWNGEHSFEVFEVEVPKEVSTTE